MQKDYDKMTDEEICAAISEGSKDGMDYLLDKYKGLVKAKARACYLIGGESDDLVQEGMIGLMKAIRDYNPDARTSFAGFAELCVSRQIYTAVKTSQRKKHQPLNSYISLYEPADAQEDAAVLMDMLYVDGQSPEDDYFSRENVQSTWQALCARLSSYEREVLKLYLDGMSCAQIAEQINRTVKSVDNAVSRIRKKAATLYFQD